MRWQQQDDGGGGGAGGGGAHVAGGGAGGGSRALRPGAVSVSSRLKAASGLQEILEAEQSTFAGSAHTRLAPPPGVSESGAHAPSASTASRAGNAGLSHTAKQRHGALAGVRSWLRMTPDGTYSMVQVRMCVWGRIKASSWGGCSPQQREGVRGVVVGPVARSQLERHALERDLGVQLRDFRVLDAVLGGSYPACILVGLC